LCCSSTVNGSPDIFNNNGGVKMKFSGLEKVFLTATAMFIYCSFGHIFGMGGSDMVIGSALIAGSIGGIVTK
jgi:hypothetical protein